MPINASSGRVSRLEPPDLDDPDKFERIADVPILDVHENDNPIKGDVDESLLRLLAANTNARCDRGDLVALTIGHTLPDGPEVDQPPFVGYARNLSVGTFRDEPCLLADFYYRTEDVDMALRFPHRSIERVRSPYPDRNYIDYVSLLRRPPERSLGLLTYSRTLPNGDDVVRYGRDLVSPLPDAAPPAEPLPSTLPSEESMTPEQIQAFATAVAQAVVAALKPPAEAPGEPEGERVQNQEASPSGENTFVPGMVKKDDDDPEKDKDRAQYQKLQDERDGLAAQVSRLTYARRFDELEREGVLFNRDAEMSKLLRLPEDLRAGHFTTIREHYQRRSPTASAPADLPAESEVQERRAVIDYAVQHNIPDISEARSRYRQERAGRAPALESDRAAVVAWATNHGISDLQEARTQYRRHRDGLAAR